MLPSTRCSRDISCASCPNRVPAPLLERAPPLWIGGALDTPPYHNEVEGRDLSLYLQLADCAPKEVSL